jgi:hypothetical protein
MKKISIVLMTLCFALSANAFAGTKHHHKHMHHAKPAATAPAAAPSAPAAAETPAK